ncbi:hypothetical protein KC352_g24252, partial [Hortaea werneckii]
MAHQRKTSRHVRSTSEAIRAEDFQRRSIADHNRPVLDTDSPYADEEPLYSRSESISIERGGGSRSWSPAALEDGDTRTPRTSQHRPLSPSRNLPSGASTPSQTETQHGHPIANYPPPPPTWSNMPNKGQLAILSASRFVDFFQMAALQTYMVHQL